MRGQILAWRPALVAVAEPAKPALVVADPDVVEPISHQHFRAGFANGQRVPDLALAVRHLANVARPGVAAEAADALHPIAELVIHRPLDAHRIDLHRAVARRKSQVE